MKLIKLICKFFTNVNKNGGKIMKKLIYKVKNYWVKNSAKLLCALPSIIAAVLVFSSNSTTCWIVNQPETPDNLRKYRKF